MLLSSVLLSFSLQFAREAVKFSWECPLGDNGAWKADSTESLTPHLNNGVEGLEIVNAERGSVILKRSCLPEARWIVRIGLWLLLECPWQKEKDGGYPGLEPGATYTLSRYYTLKPVAHCQLDHPPVMLLSVSIKFNYMSIVGTTIVPLGVLFYFIREQSNGHKSQAILDTHYSW